MRNIDLIRQVKQQATGRWQGILASLGAEVPLNRHTACPACGVKTAFALMIRKVTAHLSVISVVVVTDWI
ncbi:hypothetical protein [Arsenophonus nasoniae]|uniref:hypothetical protein n=1 Tax=Arsenophonus nasoniae TaxID=638 RepID=UPI003145394A